ncbi:MAG TPA: hypothetical protein VF381_04895 [Thermoanaerobaculia bacterium]
MLLPLSTPIDHALPFIAVLVIAMAALCGRRAAAILFAIPLLVACAICFPDAHMRLLGYGIVVAAAFCGAFWAIEEWTFVRCAGLTVAGIALLRWIARERVEVWREIVIVAGALLIVAVMKKSPLAVAVALATAFLTPGIPTRTLLIPFAVAAIAWVVRIELVVVPAFVTAVMLILFPWSGVAARGLSYFFRAAPAERIAPLNFALKPGESIDIDVPGDAKSIALSAANGFRLKRDTVAGSLDGHPLTMRDLSDWGYMRREQWWRSRNLLPRNPAGIIRGYGYDAWVDGAGRIPLPPHVTRIRVAADPHLPADTRLQVEAFER